jgi:hypothetical protein
VEGEKEQFVLKISVPKIMKGGEKWLTKLFLKAFG